MVVYEFDYEKAFIDFIKDEVSELDCVKFLVSYQFEAKEIQTEPRRIHYRTLVTVKVYFEKNQKLYVLNKEMYGPELHDVVPFLLQVVNETKKELSKLLEKPIKFYHGWIGESLERRFGNIRFSLIEEIENLRSQNSEKVRALFSNVFEDVERIEPSVEIDEAEVQRAISELKEIFD